jgi:(E)-4-hydroxy-3-methylbut-2-enyl-diphosphate synthase
MTSTPKPFHKQRHQTTGVRVGNVQVGGGAPIVVQSMANTDTADPASTAKQCIELAKAGSELVRITVNLPEAAAAVPEIKRRMLDAGVDAPLIGDFHYNGHLLLTQYPDCAAALDKYRINPGNVGHGRRRDEQFSTICQVAVDHGKPVRIGVNGGSLNQELVMRRMQENTDLALGLSSQEILNECMVLSAVESTELALASGPARRPDHHLVQSLASVRPDRGLPRARDAHDAAAPPRPDRGRHGYQGAGLVVVGDGDPAPRGNRRHHPHLAHTEARGRSARRGLRLL